MNNDDDDLDSQTTSNAPPTDTSGKQVESDLEDSSDTPSSAHAREQEAEELRRKIAEIERKVADGN
jgi:hypothetical protein